MAAAAIRLREKTRRPRRYREAAPDAVAPDAVDLCRALNEPKHAADLSTVAATLLGVDGDDGASIAVAGVDRLGLELRVTTRDAADEYRVAFRVPARSVEDAKSQRRAEASTCRRGRRRGVIPNDRGAAAGRDGDIPRATERAERTKIDGRRRSTVRARSRKEQRGNSVEHPERRSEINKLFQEAWELEQGVEYAGAYEDAPAVVKRASSASPFTSA